jgi:viologen exporter family transport system permease protein
VRLEWELARRGYRRFAAYPAATWAGIFTNTVFGFIQAYVLLALYETRDDIGGYDAADALTYVWLTQAMLATVGIFGDADFAQRIQRGDVATDLVRPVHPLRAGLASDYGRALYHALFRGLPPLAVGAFVFDLTAPRDPVVWAVFLTSVVLAVAVSFAFRFLYNLSAFWLLDYRGALRISVALAAFFSGFIIPVRFFPDWLQTLAYATPFPSMLQLPVDVFVGASTGTELVGTLAMQAGWAIALVAACQVVFSRGTRKLVVQGG